MVLPTLGLLVPLGAGCYGGRTGSAGGPGGEDNGAEAGADGQDGDGDGNDDGAGSDGSDGGDAAGQGSSAPRLWRLTPRQYDRTISAALGTEVSVPSIAITLRTPSFINDATALLVDEVWLSALEADVDELVAAHLDGVRAQMACAATEIDEACLTAFVTDLTRRIQRTDQADVQGYVDLFDEVATLESEDMALQAVVTAVLLAPKTLFRTEIGDLTTTDATASTVHERVLDECLGARVVALDFRHGHHEQADARHRVRACPSADPARAPGEKHLGRAGQPERDPRRGPRTHRGSPVELNDDGAQSLLFRLPDPGGTQVISTVAFHDCDAAG